MRLVLRVFYSTSIVVLAVVCLNCRTEKYTVLDSSDSHSQMAVQTPTATPVVETIDEPEVAARPLNKQQRRELDNDLPPKVREVLEKADILEIRGLSSEERTGLGWNPDVVAGLGPSEERRALLNSFYYDASHGLNPSACFVPRHSLKATYEGKTVEVIICYQCQLFDVIGDLGEYHGGMYVNGSAAHRIIHKIMNEKGRPIT